MQRIGRVKLFIIATIACAVLFCIAAFSLSLAKWIGGSGSSAEVEVNSNAANFYVEYPRYVTNGSDATDIPQLASSEYYLQVPKHGNTAMSYYYEMWENEAVKNSPDPQKMVTNVPLYENDTFSVYKGTTKQPIYEKRTPSTDYFQFNTDKTYKVTADGYYNIYFEYNWEGYFKLKVDYVGALNSGNNEDNGDTINTTGYTYLFSVKFSDDPQEKQLWFKTGTGARDLYADLNNFAVHIRKDDPGATGFYYNTNTYPGKQGVGDGNMRYVRSRNGTVSNPLEGQTLNVGTKAETVIVFGFEEKHYSQAETHSGIRDLSDYAVGAINLISLHTAKNVAPQPKGSGGSSGGGGSEITPAEAYCEGLTDLDSADIAESGKKTVRLVNATTTANGETEYVYKNYICVSRKNSETTDDDNSIAYLEFEVTDCKINGVAANPYDVKVKSLKIRRRATDANGNIKSRFINPAPRIYNYDSKVDTRLGYDTSDNDYSNPDEYFVSTKTYTDEQLASARKPLFARGKTHAANSSEGAGHMKDHFDDGLYVVLYFGDSDQQYFALDIEIVTDVEVEFTLNAEVANKNSWERYEDGYGEPWGYYMGGLINSVETWDPSRTTKLERASNNYVTDYDASLEDDIVGNIETASDETIDDFNQRNNFNYRIIRFYKTGGALEGYARYPKGKIDVSLTVNLTEDSRIKMYMVDHDGHRINGHTVYVVPSEIVYDKETKKLFLDETYDIYDDDLNIIIPKTGTYIFRLVGYFHTRDEETEGHNGDIIKGDKICFKDGKRYEDLDGKAGMGLPNFNLFVDTLYITCSTAAEGNSDCTITLNGNGGKFADANGNYTLDSVQGTVTFGSDIKNLPKPKLDGKTLLGWTYVDEDGKVQDFEFGSPVTGNMTLTAKWSANYTITFDANGGEFEAGATTTAETDGLGKISVEQLNAITTPTRAHHQFKGWFTTNATTGGIQITSTYEFKTHTTVYARWKEDAKYTVTFNLNGMPGTAPEKQTVYVGEKATEPTVELPDHYKSINWNTKADGTGTTYNFNNTVSANIELFAKWTADNGVYVNGVYAGLLEPNTDKPSVTSTRLKALGVLVKSEQTAKFWYNNKYITSALYIRDNSPAAANMTPTQPTNTSSFTNADGLTSSVSGWYDMYYEDTNGNGNEGGIWLILAHAYADLEFDEENDGLYDSNNLTTPLEKFKVNEESSYELKATVTLSSATIVTIKYNNTVKNVSLKAGSLGSKSGNGVSLGAGTYTFYYDYIANTVFVEGKYLITFDANNGAWGDDQTTKTVLTGKIENGKATVSNWPDNPSRGDKYTFKGWYTATTGGSSVTASYQFGSATTVYAQWTQIKFDITFNLNGGNVDGNTADKTETTGTNGKLTSSQIPTPARAGFFFGGWYTTAANDANEQVDVANKVFSTNTTVYAKWQYQVEFYANGGTWSGDPHGNLVNQGGKAVELPAADRPTAPNGKVFYRWSTSQSGGSEFDFNTAITSTNTTNGIIKLYAQWAQIYTIYYTLPDGASNNSQNPTTYSIVDGSKTLGDPTMPTGKNFLGWKLNNASGAAVTEITPTNISTLASGDTTITLYADWEQVTVTTFTITFDADGGTCATASAITGSDGKLTSSQIPTPTRDLHDFDGWYTSGGSMVTADTVFTSEQTVTARWTATQIRFRFVKPNGFGTIINVKISVCGDYGEYSTATANENTVTITPEKGKVIRVYVEFQEDGKSWTAKSVGGYADYEVGKTYTITWVSWGQNPDWNGDAPFNMSITDSDGNTITTSATSPAIAGAKVGAEPIGSNGVWLVGEGLSGGGWFNGIEIPDDGTAVIIKVTDANSWLKIRNGGLSDSSGTNGFASGSDLYTSGDNFFVNKGAGYYKFTWENNKVKAVFLRA